jgi:uncharacterized protein YndB with AHSA1/START domain
MSDGPVIMNFSSTVLITRSAPIVWEILTDPAMMIQWMGEPEMQIEIETNWQLNSPITIRGFHHVRFENKGLVLEFKKEKRLCYTHLSSLSRLPDVPENYSKLLFTLTARAEATELTVAIENFPTESIRKHLEFYWRGTLARIKATVEKYPISS